MSPLLVFIIHILPLSLLCTTYRQFPSIASKGPPHTVTMGKKRVLISYGVDVDAVSGWLGSYGGEDSPNDISRGQSIDPCPIELTN